VFEVAQRPDPLDDDVVGGAAVQIAHEVDAAGIVFVGGVVQTLCGGQVALMGR